MTESARSGAGQGATTPVLVVDDDQDIREMLELVLQTHGWRVATASDGEDALRWLRGGERPCLILLDLMMPGMDGYAFRRAQLAEPQLAEIPTVVLTGAGKPPPDTLGLDVLIKPIELHTLLDCLARHCPELRPGRRAEP
jgi:CheY-like chemotaxis protein